MKARLCWGLFRKSFLKMRRPPWIRKNTTAGMTLTLSGLKPPGNGWRKSQSFGRNAMPKDKNPAVHGNMNNHQELVQSFDEELWYSTVDYVTVYEDKRLVFTFRDGRQVEITAELWRAA